MSDLFHDRDTREAMRSGGSVSLGRGRVLRLPGILGFCGGVVRALRMLERTLSEGRGRRIWLLGEIIHNATVNDHFRRSGVRILPEDAVGCIPKDAAPEDVFVIPAFGLPREMEREITAFAAGKGLIVDTTCPYVKRIWTFVRDAAAGGHTVMIHGKPDHPETRATLSRALTPANAVVLIPTIDDAEAVARAVSTGQWTAYPDEWVHHPERIHPGRIALVNQTTMLYGETRLIATMLNTAAKQAGGTARIAETVCRATQDRQDAAKQICSEKCDLILVLGGFTSSNTNQLYRMAAAHSTAYFIQSAAALHADRIRHYVPEARRVTDTANWFAPEVRRIGLLAGASCPWPDIGDVIRTLQQLSSEGS